MDRRLNGGILPTYGENAGPAPPGSVSFFVKRLPRRGLFALWPCSKRGTMDSLNQCCKSLLDVIPLMVFIVDEDVRMREMNSAAVATLGTDLASVFNKLGGEVLHCLHAHDVPEGCGSSSHCKSCVIRNSVAHCLSGQTITRRRAKLVVDRGDGKKDVEILITATPMHGSGESLVLLIMEDISEFTMLKDIVPICMYCKRIRDDQNYWQSVENYFREFAGFDFSHGICPECIKEHYPAAARKLFDKDV
jgi:hypothetical protein